VEKRNRFVVPISSNQRRSVRLFFILVELLLPLPTMAEELHGVVVESIGGWALEEAGIQTEDVLLSWRRLPNPPAVLEAAEGELLSYFDWLELEVEQAPRGIVEIKGLRDGKSVVFTVERGFWDGVVRPVLLRSLEEVYLAGRRHIDSGRIDAAVRVWRTLEDAMRSKVSGDLQAWIALLMGKAWSDQGNWEMALESTQDGLGVAESPAAQAATWLAIGEAYERRNEFEAAETSYASALEICQKLSHESLRVSSNLAHLGELAFARGDLDRAHTYHLRTLQIRERVAPGSLIVATSLNNIGTVYSARGELDKARDYYAQALHLQEQFARESLDVATSLNNLGVIASVSGDLEGAQAYYARALRIREELAPESLVVANSLNNLGGVARSRGNLAAAKEYQLRALNIQERRAPESLDVATSLNHLGVLANECGELGEAYDYFRRSLQIRERLAPQSLDVASSLNNLGSVALSRGELDRAQEHHFQALQIRNRLAPESLAVAVTLNNLGTVAHARGDLDVAQEYHSKALRIREELAPESLAVATSLNNLGVVAHDRQELVRAYEYHLQANRILEQLAPESLVVARSLSNLGALAHSRGEFDRAQDHQLQALRIQEQLAPNSLDMAVSLNNLGGVYRDLGQANRAWEFYDQTLGALEKHESRLGGSYNIQANFRAQYGDYYFKASNHALTQGRLADAFHVVERFRARVFLAMLADRDSGFSVDVPEALGRERRQLGVRYDRTLNRLARLNLRDHIHEVQTIRADLLALEHEAGDLEVRIRRVSPRLASLHYPRPLDAASAREALDPGTLLLSYCVSEDQTELFTLSGAGDLRVKILPAGSETVRLQVERLRSSMLETKPGSSLSVGRMQLFQAESRALYDVLLKPVADQIAASERLLIVPDGPLYDLPFGALIRSGAGAEGDQYLVEWKALHVALSATVFAELKQERRISREGDAPSTPMKIAAFGDPSYPASLTAVRNEDPAFPASPEDVDSSGRTLAANAAVPADPTVRSVAERGIFDWSPLPYTRREVEGIASLFPEGAVRTFLGAEALEERIKGLDRDTRVLHIAAHGHTDEHLPSSSFIALTIPEDVFRDDTDTERDNGLLQVWEIFERVRIDADLVVLSACESGLGQELGTEGLIGLTRAFQYAGARSVVASLWSVADQSTSELMIRFYRHLRDGLSKDEALRAAQIELIRGPIEVTDADGQRVQIDASAPYYWAAFQIFGDWQ